jgi:pimeloyl-ACP methyl ester carboxylesterase
MLKTEDNAEGVPEDVFVEFITKIQDDRPAFMVDFAKTFFGVGLLSRPVSQAMLDATLFEIMKASSKATTDCIFSFGKTDFRKDVLKFDIPTLIIHGDADKIVPFEGSSKKTASLIQGSELKIYEGEPHGLYYTSKYKLNEDLISFIRTDVYSRDQVEAAGISK